MSLGCDKVYTVSLYNILILGYNVNSICLFKKNLSSSELFGISVIRKVIHEQKGRTPTISFL